MSTLNVGQVWLLRFDTYEVIVTIVDEDESSYGEKCLLVWRSDLDKADSFVRAQPGTTIHLKSSVFGSYGSLLSQTW